MKTAFVKTAFIFLVCIAFAQTSSAMGWRHGWHRGYRHFGRPRAYVYVAPPPFVQPYYAPQPYYPPMVYGRPYFRGEYRHHSGCRR